MEEMYLKKAMERCSYCMDIGRALEQVSITQNAAEAMEQLSIRHGLRIAVITSTLTNARDVVEEILDKDAAALISSMDAEKSDSIQFSYGENAEAAAPENQDESVTTQNTLYAHPLLKDVDLTIYTSRNSFTDFNWKKELSSSDFVFLTVSATQLFNQAEKNFIQTCIRKYVGAARFAMILADTAMINSEEAYNDVRDSVNWHLSSQGMSTDFFELGTNTLPTYISEKLLADAEKLHQVAAEQISAVCCEETKTTLEAMLKEADSDEAALVKALEDLKNRADKMRSNGSIAANMAYGDISGTLTYNATQAIHNFCGQLNDEVSHTLEESEDVSETLELIPDYMRNALQSFEKDLQKSLETDSKALSERLTARMNADAGEFLSGNEDVLTGLLPENLQKEPTIDFVLPENTTKRKTDSISKALLIGSIPVFIFTGFLTAAGTVAASQVLKKTMQKKIALEDKNNALATVHTMCSDLEQEMTVEIRKSLGNVASDTEKKVQNAYAGFVSAIMNLVQEKLAAITDAKAHRSQVEDFMKQL